MTSATGVLLDALAEADALPYDAMLATDAHGVYARAMAVQWPDPGRRVIGNAMLDLAEALKRYWNLRNGIVPRYLPGIEAGPEGFAKALRMVAEETWEAAGDVTEAVREHIGAAGRRVRQRRRQGGVMSTGTEVAVRHPQGQAAAIPAKLAYARALADSGLLPSAYRRNPANVLWAVEYGEMLGLPPMAAMTGVHVIEGKPTASAGLISGLVRQAGHKLRVWGTGKSATCEIVRSDDPEHTFSVTWTLRKEPGDNPSAEEAGLLGKNVWKNYPASMLKSRAITQCARDACEEVLYGLHYTAEELGAEVDEDGQVVGLDPAIEAQVVTTDHEWLDATLRIIPEIGLDACRKLWAETREKFKAATLTEAEQARVLDLLKARMEALAKPQQDAEATTDAAEAAPPVAAVLDPEDPWAVAIRELVDAGEAERLLDDARDQAARTELNPDRLALIEQAVEELFPGITTTETAAAA